MGTYSDRALTYLLEHGCDYDDTEAHEDTGAPAVTALIHHSFAADRDLIALGVPADKNAGRFDLLCAARTALAVLVWSYTSLGIGETIDQWNQVTGAYTWRNYSLRITWTNEHGEHHITERVSSLRRALVTCLPTSATPAASGVVGPGSVPPPGLAYLTMITTATPAKLARLIEQADTYGLDLSGLVDGLPTGQPYWAGNRQITRVAVVDAHCLERG
ncbi:hypothetical protein GCM10029964_092940 [Kibdelosporangium lantanae]